jgi:hypothetical protein
MSGACQAAADLRDEMATAGDLAIGVRRWRQHQNQVASVRRAVTISHSDADRVIVWTPNCEFRGVNDCILQNN